MKRKQVLKIIVDILMTFVLLLLMARSLVGDAAHEWLGIGMFALFVAHHILNSKWSRSLFRGNYTPFRVLQTELVVLVLISMIGSMVSGIVISRYDLTFLPISGGSAWARTLHMLCAYWGFVFMSLHLGLHWSVVMGMAKRLTTKPSRIRAWILRAVAILIAGYGIFAFHRRNIGEYMMLRSMFVFFDFSEPLILFLLDYLAVMGLFVCIGHYFIGGRGHWLRGESNDSVSGYKLATKNSKNA